MLQGIYQKCFPKTVDNDDLPKSHKSVLERICYGHKLAHFGEYDITNIGAQELAEQGCRFLVLEKPMGMVFLTIIVGKDSPFRKVFDFQ